MTLKDCMQYLKNPKKRCLWRLWRRVTNIPDARDLKDMRRGGYHKSQIHELVSWEMHCLLGSVDSSTKFVGCSPQRDYPAKANENRRLERANGRSPDREQNTYEQGTGSRANDRLDIWCLCLGHWVFAITVAIEANECFKQTTEIPSDGHLYTDDVSAAQLSSLAACHSSDQEQWHCKIQCEEVSSPLNRAHHQLLALFCHRANNTVALKISFLMIIKCDSFSAPCAAMMKVGTLSTTAQYGYHQNWISM